MSRRLGASFGTVRVEVQQKYKESIGHVLEEVQWPRLAVAFWVGGSSSMKVVMWTERKKRQHGKKLGQRLFSSGKIVMNVASTFLDGYEQLFRWIRFWKDSAKILTVAFEQWPSLKECRQLPLFIAYSKTLSSNPIRCTFATSWQILIIFDECSMRKRNWLCWGSILTSLEICFSLTRPTSVSTAVLTLLIAATGVTKIRTSLSRSRYIPPGWLFGPQLVTSWWLGLSSSMEM